MMHEISTSGTYAIEKGLQQVHIMVDTSLDVSLKVASECEGSLVLEVAGSGSLNLEVDFAQGGEWTYLWINRSDDSLQVNEILFIQEGAQVSANYAEMTLGKHQKHTEVRFVGPHSRVVLRGAMITFNGLEWDIRANHFAKHSHAEINCNAIVLDHASLTLEVVGHIAHGFSKSETHQASHIMNLGDNLKGIVYPKLLIDENDVAASHAASVGQPNEEHIYYLQSRGLSRLDALKLITMGYLTPIVQDVKDESIRKELEAEIEMKVNHQWKA